MSHIFDDAPSPSAELSARRAHTRCQGLNMSDEHAEGNQHDISDDDFLEEDIGGDQDAEEDEVERASSRGEDEGGDHGGDADEFQEGGGGEAQVDEGSRMTSKSFFRKFDRLLSQKATNLFSGVNTYKLETLQEMDKYAGLPGAITIVVTPLGSIDYRISSNLDAVEIVKKYAHRLVWALTRTLEERRFDNTEEDLAHVDKTRLPQEVLEKQQVQIIRKKQQRKEEYFNKVRLHTNALLLKMKIALGEIKYCFCPATLKNVCTNSHDEDCTARRAQWKWPEDVPFVNVSSLSQEQMLKVCRRYEEELQIPQGERMPVQGANPRCVYALFVACIFLCGLKLPH